MIEAMQTEVKVVGSKLSMVVRAEAGEYYGVLAGPEKGKRAPAPLVFSCGEEATAAAAQLVRLLREYPAVVAAKGIRFGIWGTKRQVGLCLQDKLDGAVLLVSHSSGAPRLLGSDKVAEAVGYDFAEALLPEGSVDWATKKLSKLQVVR